MASKVVFAGSYWPFTVEVLAETVAVIPMSSRALVTAFSQCWQDMPVTFRVKGVMGFLLLWFSLSRVILKQKIENVTFPKPLYGNLGRSLLYQMFNVFGKGYT